MGGRENDGEIRDSPSLVNQVNCRMNERTKNDIFIFAARGKKAAASSSSLAVSRASRFSSYFLAGGGFTEKRPSLGKKNCEEQNSGGGPSLHVSSPLSASSYDRL